MKNTIMSNTITIISEGHDKLYGEDANPLFNESRAVESIKELFENAEKVVSGLDKNEKIGVLITKQDMIWSETSQIYIGGNIGNVYSHIQDDRSNWVTVEEFIEFLAYLKSGSKKG